MESWTTNWVWLKVWQSQHPRRGTRLGYLTEYPSLEQQLAAHEARSHVENYDDKV